MYLIAGLGNLGAAYQGNRHNIGFMAADALVSRWRGRDWSRKFQSLTSELTCGDARVLVLKPQTYMNESGRALREAMQFYKIELENVFVFHDELDLAPSLMRVKTGGGHAGHNGLRSIMAHCGAEFHRVRLGIGHPGDKAAVHHYVLNDFAVAERGWVDDICFSMAEALPMLLAKDISGFQNKVHTELVARGHRGKA